MTGSGGAAAAPTAGRYRLRVTRTEHGIPHVVAKDWESLGYGHGYDTAETPGCNLLASAGVLLPNLFSATPASPRRT